MRVKATSNILFPNTKRIPNLPPAGPLRVHLGPGLPWHDRVRLRQGIHQGYGDLLQVLLLLLLLLLLFLNFFFFLLLLLLHLLTRDMGLASRDMGLASRDMGLSALSVSC